MSDTFFDLLEATLLGDSELLKALKENKQVAILVMDSCNVNSKNPFKFKSAYKEITPFRKNKFFTFNISKKRRLELDYIFYSF